MTNPHADSSELAPSTSAYFNDMGKRAALLIPLLAFFGYRSFANSDSPSEAFLLIGLIVVTVAVAAGLMVVHFRTSRISLTSDHIAHSGALVRDKTLPLRDLQGLLAPVTQPMTPPSRMLILRAPTTGTSGETVRLAGSIWSDDDLARIATHAGAAIEDEAIAVAAVEQRLPGSMPFWMRRPWLVAFVVTVVLVGGITAAVLTLA